MSFSKEIRDLLVGTPFGDVYPPRPDPPPLPYDARTAGMRVLRKYLSQIDFFRRGETPTGFIKFRIDEVDILIEWPDGDFELKQPALAFIPGEAKYESIGLMGSYIDESTRDKFAKDTAIQQQAEYVETFQIQIYASKRAERRAIFAGLERLLSPTEQVSGLRFHVPEYYDEQVVFALQGRQITDGDDSSRDRRTGIVTVEMRMNIVSLVNVTDLTVITRVEVVDDVEVVEVIDE